MKKTIPIVMGKAHDALSDAEVLLVRGRNSGAVGRAYYAMYHAASAMLLNEGVDAEKHSAVRAEFGRVFAKPGLVSRKFGKYLSQALKLREDADYVTESPTMITTEIAKEQVARAREFLAMAEKHLGLQSQGG